LTAIEVYHSSEDATGSSTIARTSELKSESGQKAANQKPIFLGSIAAAVIQCVTLAESEILQAAGELGPFVN